MEDNKDLDASPKSSEPVPGNRGGLKFSYPTRQAYRDAWENAAQETPPVPLNVDIELASLCNLSCPFCFIPDPSFDKHIRQKAADGKPRARMMPKQMALRLIKECGQIGVPAVKFNWRGESTLHPDYSEIVGYAKRWETIHERLANTNANCGPRAVNGLMHTTKVMISMDSLVPSTYSVMRRGGNLEKAKAVVRELIERGHRNVWVRRVLSKDNQGEDFVRMARLEFGVNVHVSEHYCFDRNAKSAHERPGCDHDGAARIYCTYPSTRLVVASTGLVYPCCIDLHEEMPVGDVSVQSLLEIWEGEPMRRLRSELTAGKLESAACKGCESWMSHDAPQRRNVQDVEAVS